MTLTVATLELPKTLVLEMLRKMYRIRHFETKVIDLKGRRVVPGFHDSHVHFLSAGLRLAQVALKDAKDEEEFGKRLKAFDAKLRSLAARFELLTLQYTGPWAPYHFTDIVLRREPAPPGCAR